MADTAPRLDTGMDTASPLAQLKRRVRDGRTRRAAMAVLAALVVLWVVVRAWEGSALERERRAARRRQHLEGFSESRMGVVPPSLRTHYDLPLDDLLTHPILTGHETPTCRLNTYQQDRYAPLLPLYRSGGRRARAIKPTPPHDVPRHHLTYFVAINLYDSSAVLPSLIRALYSLVSSLGPSRFHISIYENGSKDDTPVQLFLLAKLLKQLGAGYTIVSDPKRRAGWPEGKRIEGLANLRNLVLQPLYDAPAGTWDRVLFLNDVHLCEAELLEILLQHEVQDADMSCGMDFKELRIPEFEGNYPLLFYDVWVSRDMQGLPFYEIKQPSGEWTLPSRIMPQSDSRFRYDSLLPTQVYSCFNGVTVLDASLFAAPHSLRFRPEPSGTDEHSECFLLCSDIWKALSPLRLDGTPNKLGRGARIQIVPRASVGYRVAEYEKARKDRNTTAFEVEGAERRAQNALEMVEWERWPPRLVTTYPYGHWDNQISIPPF
ncbi:hypothetical protein JCM10450v2_005618 [Rhodotorula kratochvilovae]